MFSLGDGLTYWLYSEPTDMRKSFFTLSGLVSNNMGRDPLSGDVFIFLNKGLNRIKLLRMEPGGLVLYSKILDSGRFYRPELNDDGNINWEELVLMVSGIIKKECSKKSRLNHLNLLRNRSLK